ncbi:glycosyltransferase [Thermosynechococcus sp.]|uniref:glycosyltransferase n=1 Tax=Thermosynechococcus sp. TaxID=2814275 RepID=UPI0026159A7F|nr:glycosyltransferase [Thermosynechococcus sp.]
MQQTTPSVSIGMPVYNGAGFSRQALDSILAQTYPHFELIISDNASTDDTAEICQEYASRDSRIRYVRQEKNIGAACNFRYVLDAATHDRFIWAAADDWWDQDRLEHLVQALTPENAAVVGTIRRYVDGVPYAEYVPVTFEKGAWWRYLMREEARCEKVYYANGLLPAATPLAIMLGVFAWGASGGWQVLAVALTAGAAIESGLLLIALARMGLLAWTADFKTAAPILSASLGLLPGTFVMAFGPLIEQAIAAGLGEGSNAALTYGYKLPAAVQSILVTAIGITALPYFSAQIGQGRHAYSLHSLNKLTLALLTGGALLALPLGLFSAEIAALLYQRGAFDASATARVVPIQLAYFIQIPFALVTMLGIKAVAALRRNGLLSLYTALGVLLQALLAYALATRHGLPGIAWAAVIVSALMTITTYLTTRGTLRRLSP